MFSPQKQTEFDLITVKDRPAWDAVYHVEGPNLPCIILMDSCQAPKKDSGGLTEPGTCRCPNHPLPDISKQVARGSHEPILPLCRTAPLLPGDKAVQIT